MQFEDICKENYARIYNYILAKTGSKEAAEDITQEVFLIAYKDKKFLHHEKPVGYLYVTAKNLVMDYYRQVKKVEYLNEFEMESEYQDVFEQICYEKDRVIDEDIYKTIILQQLSESERKLYCDYYIQKKTMKEIAMELGINEASIRMKFVRIRKRVKKIVSQLELGEF